MVQLSTLPSLDSTPPPELSVKGVVRWEEPGEGPDWSLSKGPSPEEAGHYPDRNLRGPEGPSVQHFCLDVSTAYYGYDSYIEDGLICIKHKVRNLEKKKQKLYDYKKRMSRGEALNKDQLVAVEKYEEVLHNITFARELHKILDGLTQNLLKAQQKAMKKEQMAAADTERKHLTTVLQVQHLLSTLQQEQVQGDLLSGQNQAPHVPAHKLHSLKQLAALLGVQRNNRLSLEQHMEQAAVVYLDLLEGKDQPVAGSSFKLLKEELTRLLDCTYFNRLPAPPKRPEVERSSARHSNILKSKAKELSKEYFISPAEGDAAPAHNWHEDFQTLGSCEPPDSWDMDFSDTPTTPQDPAHKCWRGKGVPIKKPQADCKQRKQRKPKAEQNIKSMVDMDLPMEVFSSPSAFPKDPILRKQHLEDLVTKIHGSFSFMQESLLDGESSPTKGHHRHKRWPSGSPSALAQPVKSPAEVRPVKSPAEVRPVKSPAEVRPVKSPAEVRPVKSPAEVRPVKSPAEVRPVKSPAEVQPVKSPAEVQPEPMHSTPLPARLLEHKANFASGEQSLGTCDLKLLQKDLPHEPFRLSARKTFPSPPLYRRESNISISLDIKSRPQTPVYELEKLSPCNEVESCSSTPPQGQTFSTSPSRRSLISTQFQTIQSVLNVNAAIPTKLKSKSDSVFSEPKNTVGTQTPPEFAPSEDEPQSVYQTDYLEDNSGQVILSPGQLSGRSRSDQLYYMRGSMRGGPYTPQAVGDAGPLLYPARDQAYEQDYRRGGRHHSGANWNDSSQMSSPDRDGVFTILDSGLGDSMSVSTVEVPLTPHSHNQHANLVSMQLYPLSQPMRVAFTASRTVNFAPGNLDQPIVFDQLHSNLGGMYDAHIGRFTCPVNGTYVFIFHILKLAVNVPLYINLMRNEEVMVSAYANDGAPDHETASNHAILPLFQGDQLWLRLHRGAIYGSTWKYSTFSGFLLYQD